MDLLASIHKLPKTEKLRVMEFLWSELTSSENNYISPKWHQEELHQTEQRLPDGKKKRSLIGMNPNKNCLMNTNENLTINCCIQ